MNLLINIIFLILIKSSFIITSSNYYVQKDGYICLSCPVVKEDDTSSSVDVWAAGIQEGQSKPLWITLCRDQGKEENRRDSVPGISYSCKNNQICLYQYKSTYPRNFQCLAGPSISYVNITYMGKFFFSVILLNLKKKQNNII
jgi:hypothetical protein